MNYYLLILTSVIFIACLAFSLNTIQAILNIHLYEDEKFELFYDLFLPCISWGLFFFLNHLI